MTEKNVNEEKKEKNMNYKRWPWMVDIFFSQVLA